MTAQQRAVVDDSGNINVHGRSGLVIVVKVETDTEDVYRDISDDDLFFEVSRKVRVALSAGDDDYSRKIILTRTQVAGLGTINDFALLDETPDTPANLWSGDLTTYGFKTAPTGAEEVDGSAINWTGGTVIIRRSEDPPVVVVRYEGPPGSRVVAIPLSVSGRPDASEEYRIDLDGPIPLVEARCKARVKVASTGAAVFTIALDGSTVGTATFTAGVLIGVVDITTAALSAGLLTITAPASQDATLSGLTITLSGDR